MREHGEISTKGPTFRKGPEARKRASHICAARSLPRRDPLPLASGHALDQGGGDSAESPISGSPGDWEDKETLTEGLQAPARAGPGCPRSQGPPMEASEVVFLIRSHRHAPLCPSGQHPLPEQLPVPLAGDPCFLTRCPPDPTLPSQSAAAQSHW